MRPLVLGQLEIWGGGRQARRQSPSHSQAAFPGRPERSSAHCAVPTRPLTPSVSRWNYYSESERTPRKLLLYCAKIPPLRFFFPPRFSEALPFWRQEGNRVEVAAAGREQSSPGVLGRVDPGIIKGWWAEIRQGISFSRPLLPPSLYPPPPLWEPRRGASGEPGKEEEP